MSNARMRTTHRGSGLASAYALAYTLTIAADTGPGSLEEMAA